MKNIANQDNCYFTSSLIVDLVAILTSIFEKDKFEDKYNIYNEKYIEDIKKNHRFLSDMITYTNFNDYRMLEFLEECKAFNDLSIFSEYVSNLDKDHFLYKFYGEVIPKDRLRECMQDEEKLAEVYEEYSYVSDSYIAFRSLFYDTELFKKEYLHCLDLLYTEAFKEKYKEMEKSSYEDYYIIEQHLSKLSPIETSQLIMGKKFKNRGPYEEYYFVPSKFINRKAMRFFSKNQVLIYSNLLIKEEMTKEQITKILKVISDDTRFEIVELLSKNGAMMGKELAEALKVSTPTISHHIDQFKEIGFINEERVKNSKYYSINSNAVDKFMKFFSTMFTRNAKIPEDQIKI
ncbi:winged helix-turn-helix transcriptional regulator [Clostridium sp. 19966]|uniref:ArsR/SmtB family transcription factor n=1 Tax=Clostridium sp. 19966 TaxID=2768166 RepID=UPI0028DFE9EC|nr:metalloregulator ArsR/SmtB family transcription factor [Clostridium sp. 19966]MDT8715996.1 winged helix-turn-helix transcriptional regulator [Clostridium sp. 19966]